MFMQQRYYDPGIGAFLSVDPVTAYSNPFGQFHRYRYANNSPYRFTDPDGRETKCANNQCVTTADTFDAAKSNGKSAVASTDVRAKAESTKWKARSTGTRENSYFIARDETGNLSTSTPSNADASTGGGRNGTTVDLERPANAVALVHGHIERGPLKADGMVDAPAENGGWGDTQSLRGDSPIPTATVFKGNVGWHEIVDGRLQFSYPEGSLTPTQTDAIQNNLDVEQRRF